MHKKQIKRAAACLLILVMCLCLLNGCGKKKGKDGRSEYRVCMITDAGDITDQSFNQMTHEACRDFCREHHLDYTYKKPDGDTDYARTAMVDVAVAEGYNIIIMPGYVFAETLIETTFKYPDIKFIAMDLGGSDIAATAVGNAYYKNPEKYNPADYYNTENTYCAVYQEHIAGYLAGYTAVKLGFRKLGFLGGMAVPGVMRYGYGYVQGINDAAKEMKITKDVSVRYAYAGQFFGSTEITAAMDTWYDRGTEVVFACGGGIFTSVAEAADKEDGKVIGVDSDQAEIIDAYGEGITVTSALKSLSATVNNILDAIVFSDTWDQHVGKIESLGLVSSTDLDLNYIGLPEESTQWSDRFTVEDYRKLVERIYNGDVKINSSLDEFPKTKVKVDVRKGSIR